ncbi:MAG: 6-bladed beta-propeller [Tannerellaceae bacterium]
MKYLVAFSLLALMFSCGSVDSQKDQQSILFDPNGLKYPFDGMIDSMYLVALETTDDALLSNKNTIVLNDSLIFCHSNGSKQIAVFYRDGKHRNTISRFGQGGEEYNNISSYFISEDTIVINDYGKKKLMYYSLDGNFIQARNLPDGYSRVYPYGQDGAFVALVGFSNPSYPTRVVLLDSDLKERKEIFRYAISDDCKGINLYEPLTLQQDGTWYFSASFTEDIYAIEGDSCKMKYEFDFGSRSLKKNNDMNDLSSLLKQLEDFTALPFVLGLGCITTCNDWMYVGCIESTGQNPFFVNLKTGVAYRKNFSKNGSLGILEQQMVRDNDYFVGVMTPSRIHFIQRAFKRRYKDLFDREPDAFEQQIVDFEIDEEANPVLCFFKLK